MDCPVKKIEGGEIVGFFIEPSLPKEGSEEPKPAPKKKAKKAEE